MYMCLLGATISGAQALCMAKSVTPGPGGLPTEEVIACSKDVTNKNVRQAYKSVFCTPNANYGSFTSTYPILRDIMNASGPIKSNNVLLEKIARALLSQPESDRYLGVRGLLTGHPLDFLRKELMGTVRITYEDMKEYLDPREMGRGDAKDLTKIKTVKFLIESKNLQNTEPYKSLYAIANRPLGPSAHKDLSSNPATLLLQELFEKIGEEMYKVAIGMNANQLIASMRDGILKDVDSKANIIQVLLE